MTQRKRQKIGIPQLCKDWKLPVSPWVPLSSHPPKSPPPQFIPSTRAEKCSGEVGNLEGVKNRQA
jgi:hypothetical protein